MEEKKTRFLKTYANLPLNIRNDVVYVYDDKGPITWNAAYIEIAHNTPMGKELLDKLDELKFI